MTGYCPDCEREWTGHSEAHCASCCQHFSSDEAFDRHLALPQAEVNCYPPDTVTRKDGSPYYEVIERAHGPVWKRRRDQEHPFSAGRASSESSNSPSESPSRGAAA